jgi:hypothetical protein
MRSFLAALRTLVLPYGHPSGQRIVLDGVNGLIQVYNAANQLVAQIDTTGAFSVFDPAGGSDIVMRSAAPPVILFLPGTFGAHALGTGSIGADEQTVPDRARLLIASPRLDGADRAQITLEHAPIAGGDIPKVFISDGSAANVGARLEVFGDIEASSAGTGRQGDLLIDQVSIGRGIMADPIFTTGATSAASTGTEQKDTDLGDYTFTAKAGRLYVVHCTGRINSTVAGDQADVIIRDGGASSPTTASTQLTGRSYQIGNATGGQAVDLAHQRNNFSAGVHTIAAFYKRTAGTGNVVFRQSSGAVRDLWVEDIGPAPR